MITSYIKIALRNIWKNKGFYGINIFGLAIGVAACLLIFLYVFDEVSFDRFNKNADRIYRVNANIKFGGEEQKLAVAPDPLAFTFVRDYPEVEQAVRFRDYGPSLIKKGAENIKEENIIYADSTLFEVFTLPMIAGNPKNALAAPNTVVITESTAKKYFGTTDVLGQTLRFDNNTDHKITGVIRDIPEASHFNFDFFVTLSGVEEAKRNIWLSFNFNTYLLLKEHADVASFQRKFDQIMEKYMWPQATEFMKINQEDFKKSGNFINLTLMPLAKIHLHSDRVAELAPNNDVQVIYIFSIIAVFILLIACVNFMNLSTARSANRAREVGVRKVLGTRRINLITQFLTEAVLISFISMIIALAITALMLPFLNDLAAKKLSLSVIQHPLIIPLLIAFTVIVGLLAGSYPAFYLSSFQPIKVLKGNIAGGFKRSHLRNALVVFQFFISIVLIVATIIIYNQLGYIRNKKIGFNKEQVIHIKDAYVLDKKAETFKQEILKFPEVVAGTKSGYLPVSSSSRSSQALFPDGKIENDKAVTTQLWTVDHDYIKTLGMQIVSGRDFSTSFSTDSTAVVINEAASRQFGFGNNPVGRKITEIVDLDKKITRDFTVIGVVKNFNYESLRQNIGALCLRIEPDPYVISFRVKTGNMENTISHIRNTWKSMAPNEPFNYTFLNEEFDQMYRAEQRAGKIFMSFAALAILIACLGLFGLVTFAAEQRRKEIGIRKVLGASVKNIINMLSADFLKLVMIASVIAFPIAWYFMNKWLMNFAYRVSISWWVFAIAAVVALLIALVTVCIQAVKAAVSNPVKSLRSE